ncbi:hypothetical protein [Anaerofustis stercorihominis]|uniref:hypothetical protein n=1 Tax=Anaerofustis stercorihominis TaxID=214853 RepID=UPI00214D04A6|nr:hypothetical protein [Anaerofustis stercorihominis]MCR2033734.1 hypothetical protein [Anaerofustis stercorihominis]
MKKFITVILSVCMLMSLFGCGRLSAEESLREKLDIICVKDEDRVLEKYINGADIDEEYKDFLSGKTFLFKNEEMKSYMFNVFKNMDYKINSVNKYKKIVAVNVTFSVLDLTKAYESAVKDTVKWYKKNPKADNEEIAMKIMTMVTENIGIYAKENKNKINKNTVVLMQKKDGEWEIINMDAVINDIFDFEEDMRKINNNIPNYF